jgi:hypothetical protein
MLEVMFPITYGGVWDYPYPEAQALTESMPDQLSADRLVWGNTATTIVVRGDDTLPDHSLPGSIRT